MKSAGCFSAVDSVSPAPHQNGWCRCCQTVDRSREKIGYQATPSSATYVILFNQSLNKGDHLRMYLLSAFVLGISSNTTRKPSALASSKRPAKWSAMAYGSFASTSTPSGAHRLFAFSCSRNFHQSCPPPSAELSSTWADVRCS